jgi:single-strand DNA-binding protein
LKKGSSVIVIGEMQAPQIYTGKDGQPQVSLEMTAEIVKFSPFGRPDKPEGAAGAATQYNSGAAPQYNQGSAPQNYGQKGFAPQQPSNQSMAGMGSEADTEEEPLPF